MARHPDAADDDGRQQRQRQDAAQQTQLLADDGEDKIGVSVGQSGAVLALGLGAMEQSLPRELAAAQRHKAAGLLPAGILRVEAVVEQHLKPELHIGRDLVQIPHRPEGQSAGHAAQQKPPQGYASHKAHTGEDEQEHQRAAHVGGNLIVQDKDDAQMGCQKQDGGDAAQIAVLLEPDQLLGQHQRQCQLHDLGGLHLHRQEREIQPCPVAGVVRDTQRRDQQEDKCHADEEDPFPVFAQVAQVDLGDHQIQHHAQQQRHRLDRHQTPCVHIPGGAGHHENAEQGRRGAQRQQHQIRLAQDIRKKLS